MVTDFPERTFLKDEPQALNKVKCEGKIKTYSEMDSQI